MKQLRFSTTAADHEWNVFSGPDDVLVVPEDVDELTLEAELPGQGALLSGNAEELTGTKNAIFLDGEIGQLGLPEDEQDLLLLLPSGEYPCKSTFVEEGEPYLITLKN